MITVYSNKESIRYSAYHLVKAFLPEEEILQEDFCCALMIEMDGEEILKFEGEKKQAELLIYDTFRKLTGKELPWGVLTGVRPVKLASEKLDEMDREGFLDYFFKAKRVSEKKAGSAWDIAKRERKIIRQALNGKDRDLDTYSLYVGIPVCPSICSYCSFSSGLLSKWACHMDSYVDCLIKEIRSTAAFMEDKSLTSVYIGGGTPTVLTETQLERLLAGINASLPMSEIKEFTLEAGRPDTITEEKLRIAKEHGISRISINPQTMQQKTLDLIGRKHTTEQIIECFELARKLGFNNINMDIIAGLSGENLMDFQDTLEKIAEIKPESLTVHALAIKRAASQKKQSTASDIVTGMIEAAGDKAAAMGMNPYYLYRQKSIAGNHENVGYAFEGREGIYNIMIMEEVQSIMACGAGATSKYLLKEEVQNPDRAPGVMTNLLRHDNMKSISDYIENIDRTTAEKEKLFDIKRLA